MNDWTTFVETVNWELILPILIIQLILMVVALIDCFRLRSTTGPKWMWVIIIIFVNIIGPVLYFVVGRKGADGAH